jgi:hypothetical protein
MPESSIVDLAFVGEGVYRGSGKEVLGRLWRCVGRS